MYFEENVLSFHCNVVNPRKVWGELFGGYHAEKQLFNKICENKCILQINCGTLVRYSLVVYKQVTAEMVPQYDDT